MKTYELSYLAAGLWIPLGRFALPFASTLAAELAADGWDVRLRYAGLL